MTRLSILAAASLLAFSSAAIAQAPNDAQIASIVVTANQVDLDTGKMAQTRAHAANVKAFAKQMVTDHTGVNKQAAALAAKLKLKPVSDHGEAFYEHGVPTHGTSLLEEQIRTAAFLRLPGAPARVVSEPVSVLDLVPAMARFLGLPPHGNFQGRSDILDPGYSARGRPFPFTIQGITQEDGLLADDWKLIENRDRRERALFDLGADPGEFSNLAATEPERLLALERQLAALLDHQLAYYRGRGWESGWYPPRLP